jgi:hypothetical protein
MLVGMGLALLAVGMLALALESMGVAVGFFVTAALLIRLAA